MLQLKLNATISYSAVNKSGNKYKNHNNKKADQLIDLPL